MSRSLALGKTQELTVVQRLTLRPLLGYPRTLREICNGEMAEDALRYVRGERFQRVRRDFARGQGEGS